MNGLFKNCILPDFYQEYDEFFSFEDDNSAPSPLHPIDKLTSCEYFWNQSVKFFGTKKIGLNKTARQLTLKVIQYAADIPMTINLAEWWWHKQAW